MWRDLYIELEISPGSKLLNIFHFSSSAKINKL